MNENNFISYKYYFLRHRLGFLVVAIPAYSLAIAKEPFFLQAYVGGGNVHMDYLTEQEFTNKYVVTILIKIRPF